MRHGYLPLTALARIAGASGFAQKPKGSRVSTVPAVKPKELSLVRVNVAANRMITCGRGKRRRRFPTRRSALFSRKAGFWSPPIVANRTCRTRARRNREKSGANVVVVDYEAALALIDPAIRNFSKLNAAAVGHGHIGRRSGSRCNSKRPAHWSSLKGSSPRSDDSLSGGRRTISPIASA